MSVGANLFFQKLTGDDKPLNFTGSFTDGAELHITIEFFNGIVFDEPIAAMDLESLVGGETAISDAKSFAMADSFVTRLPESLRAAGAIDKPARSFDRRCHVRKLVLNGSEIQR